MKTPSMYTAPERRGGSFRSRHGRREGSLQFFPARAAIYDATAERRGDVITVIYHCNPVKSE